MLEAKKRLDEVKEKLNAVALDLLFCVFVTRARPIFAQPPWRINARTRKCTNTILFLLLKLWIQLGLWHGAKSLAVQKYLPRYKWLLFLDIDTLIMNPEIRLEDIADDNYEQVLGADHNGINSGVWFVKNTRWMRWFLTELWAQEELVRGNYVFHYEQRAFHHLFQTKVWSKNVGTRNEPYNGAEDVRKRSKSGQPVCLQQFVALVR